MNKTKKKVAFHTLGCKLNFAETSTISRSFPVERFERVPISKQADIYVINTCSVTDVADRKCRQAIRKFINMSPDAFIIVVGCYAQLKPQEISAISGVDLVLGINEKFDITSYLDNDGKKAKAEVHSCDLSSADIFNGSFSAGDRTRSFLKIQDGCDYGCAYCTIPMARGISKNPDIKMLISEAETIARKGIKEIVLTGVNIGDFGKSTGDSFYDLLSELVKVEGIYRYRISSIEPNLLTNDLIRLSAENSKILPHFHIPLQSGSNKILGLMRRRYKRDVFSDRINVIKELIPSAGIGADVIVGFPGESAEDYTDTYDFINSLPLSYLHVFTFSERPGTIASALPGKVSFEEKESRSKKLISLSKQKHHTFLAQNIGYNANVLFEHAKSAGMIGGYTGNYIRVEHPWKSALSGEVKKVRLSGISDSGKMEIELID
ncbi:MAG TPA: tRNA (N(6)-L-threonylcarbamoyladenosine(37)-C(2))-methylthiotransferase MtaB [Bacteroidales bacterium]|nr:tRNA (N(6)-L-threonylcarbamoyladenosine(37)-C(2))-methylthiotransferase MtaB [Bacteroidales bacterium]